MKHFLILCIVLFGFAFSSILFSKEKRKKKSIQFSEYQGEMNWKDAKAKCAKLKMKLPSRAELEKAFKSKDLVSWKKDGYWFWTSDEYSKTDAFYFDVGVGVVVDQIKEDLNHVRCKR